MVLPVMLLTCCTVIAVFILPRSLAALLGLLIVLLGIP